MVATSYASSPIRQTAYDLYMSGACMASLSAGVKSDKSAGGFLSSGSDIGSTTTNLKTDTSDHTLIEFGDKNEYGDLKKNTCGSVEIDNSTVSADSYSKLVGVDALKSVSGVYQANSSAISTLQASMFELGAKTVSSGQAVSYTEVEASIKAYQQTVLTAALNISNNADNVKEIQDAIKANGFMYFGFFYPKIQAVRSQVMKAINDIPYTTGPMAFDSGTYADTYAKNIQLASKTVVDGGAIPKMGVSENGEKSGLIDKLKNYLNFSIDKTIKTTFAGDFIPNENTDPMTIVMSWGGFLLTMGGAGGVGLSALLLTAGNLPGIGLLAQSLLQIAVPLLLGVGYTMCYVIPLIPSLIWIGAMIGFLVMAIEAIVASMFWGLMILSPSGGNEMIGAGIQGFRMLVALLFKPILLCLGFATSMVLMDTFGVFVSNNFSYIFDQSMAGSNWVTWLAGKIFQAILYLSVMSVVIYKIFSIIFAVADAVLAWISSGSAFGGHAKETSGGNATGAGGAALATVAGGALGGASQFANNKDKIKNEDRSSGGNGSGSNGFGRMMDKINAGKSGNETFGAMKANKPFGTNSASGASGQGSDASQGSGAGMPSDASNNETASEPEPKSGDVTEGKNGFEQYGGNSDAPNPSVHKASGEVVGFGKAPYKHDPENKPSFYVSVKSDDGKIRDVWGSGLKDQGFTAGERVSIEKTGETKGQELTKKSGETISHKNQFNVERLPKGESNE